MEFRFKGIIDTTLREGQQSPLLHESRKYRFNLEDKIKIIENLINLGIEHFEFFSPVVSKVEEKEFLALKEHLDKLKNKKINLLAHCRCNLKDIEQAIEKGFNGLNLYMGVSEKAQKYSLRKNFEEIVEIITQTIFKVKEKYPQIYIRFSVEDAFRTPLNRIFYVYDRIKNHVNTIGIPDTVGIATPELVKRRIRILRKRYEKLNLECHFHNDRGLALINAIEAIKNGADFVDTSIWGLGERTGITSTTALLLNLFHLYPSIINKYRLEFCYQLNALMESILKLKIPFNEPVSAFSRTHVAGVHQNSVLRNKSVYEGNNLEIFGVKNNSFIISPLTGWNYIHYYLNNVKNYPVSPEVSKEITKIFKNSADKLGNLTDPEKLLEKVVKEYFQGDQNDFN